MDSARDVGILFADIAGSTRMYELLGDERALAIVNACIHEMTASVGAHQGEVVKTIGDEVMASFATPGHAFTAAMEIRRRIAALPPVHGGATPVRVRVRIGLHFGPAVREQGDWFGDTVNTAARMVEMASAGQILTTGEVIDRLPPPLRALATEFAEIEVKGRTEKVRVARVADDDTAQENTLVRFVKAPAVAVVDTAPKLTLTIQGRPWVLPPGTRRVVLGREIGCDILLTGASASRQHATIELRRDKVVLIDHSTNGTALVIGQDRPVHLMREEYALSRSGTIVFGRRDAPDADVVGYAVD